MTHLIKKMRSITLACALVFVVTGCITIPQNTLGIGGNSTNNNLNTARSTEFKDNVFKEQLRKGYIDLAENMRAKGDRKDAKMFSEKAAAIVRGATPDLDDLTERSLSASSINELYNAKAFTHEAFARGIVKGIPYIAAHLQLAFDCWAENSEQAHLQKSLLSVNFCREKFIELGRIANIHLGNPKGYTERFLARQGKQARPTPPPALPPAARPPQRPKIITKEKFMTPEPYLVFFETNSTKIDLTGRNILEKVAREATIYRPDKIIIKGNADRVGTEQYNINLAYDRAKAVAKFLRSEGVDPQILDPRTYGEKAPKVFSSGNEPRNRYAEIVFFRRDGR